MLVNKNTEEFHHDHHKADLNRDEVWESKYIYATYPGGKR